MTRKDMIEGILVPILPILGLLLALWLFTGCAASKVACQVIRAADEACTVIEMVGEDGKVQQVPVSQQELQGFARATAVKRAGEARDAGSK